MSTYVSAIDYVRLQTCSIVCIVLFTESTCSSLKRNHSSAFVLLILSQATGFIWFSEKVSRSIHSRSGTLLAQSSIPGIGRLEMLIGDASPHALSRRVGKRLVWGTSVTCDSYQHFIGGLGRVLKAPFGLTGINLATKTWPGYFVAQFLW
jgi:hypothetical protein